MDGVGREEEEAKERLMTHRLERIAINPQGRRKLASLRWEEVAYATTWRCEKLRRSDIHPQ